MARDIAGLGCLYSEGMDAGAFNWLKRTAVQNLWRVKPLYDLEDLIQEGHLCWVRIRGRYTALHSPRELMPLFKRAYTNHIHDIAGKRPRDVMAGAVHMPDNSDEWLDSLLEPELPDIDLMLDVFGDPELKCLYEQFLRGLTDEQRERKRGPQGQRETTNDWFRRITGMLSSGDMAGKLMQLATR